MQGEHKNIFISMSVDALICGIFPAENSRGKTLYTL